MSTIVDIVKDYEKHIDDISKKYQNIIDEHRNYIFDMRNDLIKIWSMVSDNKPHKEIKQFIQNIIKERFGFYPKKANKTKEEVNDENKVS